MICQPLLQPGRKQKRIDERPILLRTRLPWFPRGKPSNLEQGDRACQLGVKISRVDPEWARRASFPLLSAANFVLRLSIYRCL